MEADLMIINAKVFNTFIQDFEEKIVYILDGKFLHMAEEPSTEIVSDDILDANGMYMIPGLIDIHMHIESSMTVPKIFSEMALSHGVTTVVTDPHEIANVFGLEGIEAFMSQDTCLDIFYGIPSSVPSTSEKLETTGGIIGVKEVERLLENPKTVCLGEVMRFKDLVSEESSLIKDIIYTSREKRPLMPIEGHCPKVSGLDLSKFIYRGVDADHTQQTAESIFEKISKGMFLEIQNKSIDLDNIDTLVKNNFYEYFALVTDDVMADHLMEGHLNRIVEKAVSFGMPIEKAIYTSTYTPARRMGFKDRGAISPGKIADFILIRDIEKIEIEKVYKNGKHVEKKKNQYSNDFDRSFPEHFYDSIKCKKLKEEDLIIYTDLKDEVGVNTIKIHKSGTFTEKGKKKVNVSEGMLQWEAAGLALIIVMERYGKNGNVAFGFVENTIVEKGAIATTWTHDHHNVMVMGTTKEDIIIAQHRLLENKGGYVVVRKGEIIGETVLEVGGIVSEAPIDKLGESLRSVRNGMRELGYENTNEIMSFSTLSLPVSPEIKITDVGLIDVKTQKTIPLIEE